MAKLDISHNQLCGHWRSPDFTGFKSLVGAIEQHKVLDMGSVDMAEELDVSGQNLGPEDVRKLAEFMKDNGVLASLNMLKNDIGPEQAEALIKIKHEKKMITLCGLTGKEKELNFSKQDLKAADAMLIADDIQDMGALAKLDLSNNFGNFKVFTTRTTRRGGRVMAPTSSRYIACLLEAQ